MKQRLISIIIALSTVFMTVTAAFHIDRVNGSVTAKKGGVWKDLKANSLLSDRDSLKITEGGSVSFHGGGNAIVHTITGPGCGPMASMARASVKESRQRTRQSGIKVSSGGVSLRNEAESVPEILSALKAQNSGATPMLKLTRQTSSDGATFEVEISNCSDESLFVALFVEAPDGFYDPVEIDGDAALIIPAKGEVKIEGLEFVNSPDLHIGVVGSNRDFVPSTLIGGLTEGVEAVPVSDGCRAYIVISEN